MKVSRWIYVPLIFGILWAVIYTLLGFANTVSGIAGLFVVGVILGFIIEIWSHFSAKIKAGTDSEEIHKVRQERNITLLMNVEKAFEFCREAVNSINPAKIKIEDAENGVIEVRTRISLETFGTLIRLNLKKINENLTEVEIFTRPIPRTVLVDYGEGWKYTEKIFNYLKKKDEEFNIKFLTENTKILENVYVKPSHKEKELVKNEGIFRRNS